MSSRFSRYNKPAPWSNFLGSSVYFCLFHCLLVCLLVWTPSQKDESKQSHYLCPAGFLDTTSLRPGQIFLVCLYIFVCLSEHLLRRLNLSKCVIYVQQVFSIQQACTLVEFSWFVYIFLFVCLCGSLLRRMNLIWASSLFMSSRFSWYNRTKTRLHFGRIDFFLCFFLFLFVCWTPS